MAQVARGARDSLLTARLHHVKPLLRAEATPGCITARPNNLDVHAVVERELPKLVIWAFVKEPLSHPEATGQGLLAAEVVEEEVAVEIVEAKLDALANVRVDSRRASHLALFAVSHLRAIPESGSRTNEEKLLTHRKAARQRRWWLAAEVVQVEVEGAAVLEAKLDALFDVRVDRSGANHLTFFPVEHPFPILESYRLTEVEEVLARAVAARQRGWRLAAEGGEVDVGSVPNPG